ncbi:MAG: ChbG/HpnK family deacetylase [Geminicoccaceae bacterium]|nr:ChbG/HpnK family deacetylase [Geminicoccaceae bacterium]
MTVAGPRPLVLCADDYGLSPGVDQGILELLAAGRLSAVSCMTATPRWPEAAAQLLPWRDRVDIGLHLTLTDQEPAGSAPILAPAGRLPSLGRLARALLVDRWARAEAAEQLDRQLASFERALGRPPDHIDGHQHAHLLPGIRGAVIAAAWRLGARRRVYLRSTWESPFAILRRGGERRKALVLALIGRGLHRQAARAGVPSNDSFRGATTFAPGPGCREEFRRFFAGPGTRPLVMCHPGRVDAELAARDPLTGRREDELRYFASPGFLHDLAEAGVYLARFDGTPVGAHDPAAAPSPP